MVNATILASPDPQVWQLLGLAQILAPSSPAQVAGEWGEVAGVRGKAESPCLDVWLL
jgi:hypothetical protein